MLEISCFLYHLFSEICGSDLYNVVGRTWICMQIRGKPCEKSHVCELLETHALLSEFIENRAIYTKS